MNKENGSVALTPIYNRDDHAQLDESKFILELAKRCPSIVSVLIDVGAHHGGTTIPFAISGFRVHSFEPDPINREKLLENVVKLPSVSVDPRAVSDHITNSMPFYTSDESTGISSLTPFRESHRKSCSVGSTMISAYCKEWGIDSIGVLKIDAEGYDLMVLKGVPWERIHPSIILCEFEDNKTVPLGYNFHDMATFLIKKGYKVFVSEWHPIIRYGISHDWCRLESYPCNLLSPNAWGNLIALKNVPDICIFSEIAKKIIAVRKFSTETKKTHQVEVEDAASITNARRRNEQGKASTLYATASAGVNVDIYDKQLNRFWLMVRRVFPIVILPDLYGALCAAWRVNTDITGRHCGDLGDKVSQYLSVVQFVRSTRSLHCNSLEIGTLFGGSCLMKLIAMKDLCIKGKVVCIDPMSGFYGQEKDPISRLPVNETVFFQNINHFGFSHGQVELRQCRSDQPEATAGLTTFGTLMIDGDHSFSGVAKDLSIFSPLLTDDGVLLFDDYAEPSLPEITRFVDIIRKSPPDGLKEAGILGTTICFMKTGKANLHNHTAVIDELENRASVQAMLSYCTDISQDISEKFLAFVIEGLADLESRGLLTSLGTTSTKHGDDRLQADRSSYNTRNYPKYEERNVKGENYQSKLSVTVEGDDISLMSGNNIKIFKDIHKGQRCVIIGNGPSLNKMDLSFLENEICFGMNRIFLMFEKWKFRPTYYVSVNPLVLEQSAGEIQKINVPKFLSSNGIQFFPDPPADMFFINSLREWKFSRDPQKGLCEGWTVTFVAMQLAYYMGFSEVVLIGVDHHFVTPGPPNKEVVSQGNDPNHFHPDYFGKGMRWHLPDLEKSEHSYHMAKTAFESVGRTIVDATLAGKLTIFPKVNYRKYFSDPGVKKRLARSDGKVFLDSLSHTKGRMKNEAIWLFEKILRTQPDSAFAHNQLGLLYFRLGNLEKAKRHYEIAVKNQPDNATFAKDLSDFYYIVLKDTEKALQIYIKRLSINPEDMEIIMRLGNIFIENGQLESARDFYERVLKIDPRNKDALKVIDVLINQDQVITPELDNVRKIAGANQPEGYLVSAVVSTYNSERFICGCIEDLEAQTIANRLEIVIVDSCSQQNERAIVEEMQQKYRNIKYIRTDKRETVYCAWNRGIKAASGKYITNANTDDRHRNDAFEIMVNELERNLEIALVYADVIITEKENETFDRHTPIGFYKWQDWDRNTLLDHCFIGPQPMWRKSVHDEYGYFDESLVTSGDYEFWLRISQTHDFYHIDTPLGLYLKYPESIEHRNWDKKLEENHQILSLYRNAVQKGLIVKNKYEKDIFSLIQHEFTEGMTSIIIPVKSLQLNECVSSIIKYTKEPHEIIFLEHDAAPKLKKQITKAINGNHNYKFIKIDKSDNFTQSLNEGINQSKGEYIVLLFDDVVVGEGWLSDMLECLHSGKKIGIVGAMSDDASSLQRVESIDFNSPENRLSFREKNRHRSIPTRYLDGFCMLFRRDLLIRVGLFDEIFGGDKHVFDDFCVRAVLEGFTNVIARNVFVHSQGGINRLLSRDKTLFDEKWKDLDDLSQSPPGEPHLKLIDADMLRTMPVLLCYPGSKENWNPPVISENEIFCGPDCKTSPGLDGLKEIRTNVSSYDISLILSNIPKHQWPELYVVRPTINNRPVNASALYCSKVAIIGKDFYDPSQVNILAEYLDSEKFDYILIDTSQIPVDLFDPDADHKPLSLYSILTGASPASGENYTDIFGYISVERESLSVLSNLILLGERLYSAGKTVEAMKCFTHVITNSGDNDSRCQAFNNIGVIAHSINEMDRAEQMFISALEIDSLNIHALLNLSDVYITQGRHDNALTVLKKAIAAHPGNEQISERFALITPVSNAEETFENREKQKSAELPIHLENTSIYRENLTFSSATPFIVCAMFAGSTKYENYADRLALSCEEFDLPYSIYHVPEIHHSMFLKGGSNLSFTKANFIYNCLDRFVAKTIVYLDIDLVIVDKPQLLINNSKEGVEFSIYNWLADPHNEAYMPINGCLDPDDYRSSFYTYSHHIAYNSTEQLICSGATQLWGNTTNARKLLRDWQTTIIENNMQADDPCLDIAFNNLAIPIKASWLPKEYIRIPWWPHIKPVILHRDIPASGGERPSEETGNRKRLYPDKLQIKTGELIFPKGYVIDIKKQQLKKIENNAIVDINTIPIDVDFWIHSKND